MPKRVSFSCQPELLSNPARVLSRLITHITRIPIPRAERTEHIAAAVTDIHCKPVTACLWNGSVRLWIYEHTGETVQCTIGWSGQPRCDTWTLYIEQRFRAVRCVTLDAFDERGGSDWPRFRLVRTMEEQWIASSDEACRRFFRADPHDDLAALDRVLGGLLQPFLPPK